MHRERECLECIRIIIYRQLHLPFFEDFNGPILCQSPLAVKLLSEHPYQSLQFPIPMILPDSFFWQSSSVDSKLMTASCAGKRGAKKIPFPFRRGTVKSPWTSPIVMIKCPSLCSKAYWPSSALILPLSRLKNDGSYCGDHHGPRNIGIIVL